MTLMHYRPNRLWGRSATDTLARLQDEVERLMEAPFANSGTQFFNVWAPALDVYEDKENLIVKLEVPGMKKEDFEISLNEGVLSISGERRLEKANQKAPGYLAERFEGRFQRSVTLPKHVQADKVRASYKDGVLAVWLPIAEEARPKQISVSAE